ncbi:acyltransferase [Sphingobium amiense]|uniref:Acyltransferase n=1 Tax=Sphingobium amiense TaxID=135719 RepID=A0A494W2R1_9SPHN|nr:acyltransferase family protein [Sphingobium amiense]BBD97438.1 acyltransferase [Sphingobium amiense]
MHGPARPDPLSAIRYRRDVDGLRSVAILPVLLFHAHVPGFSGGYVGVDIFFVISGFLITGIIAREIDAGRFSILRFYERRFRRIVPALSTMILAVLAASAWLYFPGDLEGVPRSALAASAFASNLWFFTDTGYFAGGADVKPLLHTWSLAVEEQYYIGFPILLMLLARFAPRGRVAVVGGIALISLTLAILMQRDTSGFTFYLLPTRAWELFAGALLALGAIPAVRVRWLREAIAWGGLAAVAFAVFCYDRTTIFPGITALPPVLGAAAMLYAAPGTSVGRLLSMRLLVGIGLISYSLYLWHWPLIVFTEYVTDLPLSGGTRTSVTAASFVAAILSWRFVERPFRDPARFSAKAIFSFTAAATLLIAAASLALMAQGGWPSRFRPEALRLLAARHDVSPARGQCHDNSLRGERPCILGARARPDTMLWGDSHGVELSYALSEKLRREGRALVERTTSSCPPVIGYDATDPRCAAANRAALDAIRADRGIRHVYLAAFWANGRFDDPAFVAKLDRTIVAIRSEGRSVTLIGAVPPQPFDVPRRLAHLAAQGRLSEALGVERSDVIARTIHLRGAVSRWRARGVHLIDATAILCPRERCDLLEAGRPLYFDSHHLSMTGARRVIAADR